MHTHSEHRTIKIPTFFYTRTRIKLTAEKRITIYKTIQKLNCIILLKKTQKGFNRFKNQRRKPRKKVSKKRGKAYGRGRGIRRSELAEVVRVKRRPVTEHWTHGSSNAGAPDMDGRIERRMEFQNMALAKIGLRRPYCFSVGYCLLVFAKN